VPAVVSLITPAGRAGGILSKMTETVLGTVRVWGRQIETGTSCTILVATGHGLRRLLILSTAALPCLRAVKLSRCIWWVDVVSSKAGKRTDINLICRDMLSGIQRRQLAKVSKVPKVYSMSLALTIESDQRAVVERMKQSGIRFTESLSFFNDWEMFWDGKSPYTPT
jgi:hypothetical protein